MGRPLVQRGKARFVEYDGTFARGEPWEGEVVFVRYGGVP